MKAIYLLFFAIFAIVLADDYTYDIEVGGDIMTIKPENWDKEAKKVYINVKTKNKI